MKGIVKRRPRYEILRERLTTNLSLRSRSQLSGSGKINFYHASTWSFLHDVIQKICKASDAISTPGESLTQGKEVRIKREK